jgi:formyl-CoA transferase
VALLSYVAGNYLVSGEPPRRFGNGHPNIVPYQSFPARDGYFAFAAGNDAQWKRFCEAVGQSAWVEDPRFATNGARVQNRQVVVDMLSDLFFTRPAGEWMELCESIGIPSAPINTIDKVFADPQVQARGLRAEVDHPTAGRVGMVASPLRFSASPPEIRRPPPTLGQHTDEVLGDVLGCSAEEIRGWRAAGVV